jgi:hypothetical protein
MLPCNYEEDKNKVPMNKPCKIQSTNICNGIFHISFVKALLINEGERESRRLPHNYTVTCFLDVFNIMYCFTLCLTPDTKSNIYYC